eukprot:TRINITY_DN4878_c0_g2_i1.p3 TRINITY_DN4878_c0_g2~~TRINITY_DN4878_c0_g2_i1.p3  ORF type:complete len:276 (+),score=79.74 TRINITY_DN4878_c0_g2_i1:541-1368(+)
MLSCLRRGDPWVPLDARGQGGALARAHSIGVRAVICDPATHRILAAAAVGGVELLMINRSIFAEAAAWGFYGHCPSGNTILMGLHGEHLVTPAEALGLVRAANVRPFERGDVAIQACSCVVGSGESLGETFGPLGAGCPLVCRAPGPTSPDALLAICRGCAVTRLTVTHSQLKSIIFCTGGAIAAAAPQLRLWALSGGVPSADLKERFFAADPPEGSELCVIGTQGMGVSGTGSAHPHAGAAGPAERAPAALRCLGGWANARPEGGAKAPASAAL